MTTDPEISDRMELLYKDFKLVIASVLVPLKQGLEYFQVLNELLPGKHLETMSGRY